MTAILKFVLPITIEADTMRVRPFGELVGGELKEIERYAPDGTAMADPIVIQRRAR